MANLASTWVSEHGTGSLRGKDQDSLRLALLRDLGHLLGCTPRPVVEREVDEFLASGRVSEANLRRLLRRTEARLASESGYSQHTSRASGSQSAREPRQAPVPEELLKWSQVAKLACKEAELEVVQKREAKRVAQDEIRSYLQRQIDEKNSKKQKAVEEERNFCLLQDAELERWKRDQAQKAEERVQRVQQVLRDREAQSEEVYKRREAEREQKMDEDKRLVQRATREMEKEQALVAERRQRNRLAQAAWVQEATESKQSGPKAREKRIEEEKRILQEYVELLEMQDKRRREAKPRIREQSPVLPPRVKRKGEELYYDEAIVQRIHKESLARAEQAEKRKQERLKMQRFENQVGYRIHGMQLTSTLCRFKMCGIFLSEQVLNGL